MRFTEVDTGRQKKGSLTPSQPPEVSTPPSPSFSNIEIESVVSEVAYPDKNEYYDSENGFLKLVNFFIKKLLLNFITDNRPRTEIFDIIFRKYKQCKPLLLKDVMLLVQLLSLIHI